MTTALEFIETTIRSIMQQEGLSRVAATASARIEVLNEAYGYRLRAARERAAGRNGDSSRMDAWASELEEALYS
jgi:hypothetical protein